MKRSILGLTIGLLLLLTGCGRTGAGSASSPEYIEFEVQTWRITFPGEADSPEGRAAEEFAQLLFERTHGTVQAECVPESELTEGDGTGLAALRSGEVDLGFFSSDVLADADARLGIVSLPFLFDSEEEAEERLDGAAGEALREILAQQGLSCLGIGTEGFRLLTNNVREAASPEDLRGLRLRIGGSDAVKDTYRAWGAEPVEAAWAGVFTALQTGTYDGQESLLREADAASIQEVQEYATDWTAFYSCMYFCMDRELYESLSPLLQEIAAECGAEAAAEQRRWNAEETAEILSSWRRSGVTVTSLSGEAAEEFRTAAGSCRDRLSKRYPAELLELFEGK